MGTGRGRVGFLQGYRPRSTVLVPGDGLRPMDKEAALGGISGDRGRETERREERKIERDRHRDRQREAERQRRQADTERQRQKQKDGEDRDRQRERGEREFRRVKMRGNEGKLVEVIQSGFVQNTICIDDYETKYIIFANV